MKHRFIRTATATALWAVAFTAQAQQYGSAPSLATVGKAVAVNGGGVAAGSVVSLRVTSPSGVVTVLATVAGAQGRFSQSVTAGAAGAHRIELLDADSQRFADLLMIAAPAQ